MKVEWIKRLAKLEGSATGRRRKDEWEAEMAESLALMRRTAADETALDLYNSFLVAVDQVQCTHYPVGACLRCVQTSQAVQGACNTYQSHIKAISTKEGI